MANTVISRMAAIITADNTAFSQGIKACPGIAKEASAALKTETGKVASEAEAQLQKHEANIQKIIKQETGKMGRSADRAEARQRMFGSEADLSAAGKSAGATAGKAAGEAAADGTYGGMLKGLKGSFGEESDLGRTLKIFAGAGIVGGLAIAANQFNALAGKASDYADKLALGQTTAGDMAAELARSVPIFGPLADGATKFIGMLVGITQETARINQEAAGIKAINDLLQYQIDLRKQNGIKEENSLIDDQITLLKTLGQDTTALEETRRKMKAGQERDKEVGEFSKSAPVKELDTQIEAAKKRKAAAEHTVDTDMLGGIPLTFSVEAHKDEVTRAGNALQVLVDRKAKAINDNTADANRRFRDSEGRAGIQFNAKLGVQRAEQAKGDAEFGAKLFAESEQKSKAAEGIRKEASAKVKQEYDLKVSASASMWKELEGQAKRFTEAAKSPLDKHNDQLREMTEAVGTGALKWDDYASAVANENANFAKGQQAPGVKAMQYGGAEMQRMQYDAKIQQATAKPDKDKVALDTFNQIKQGTDYQRIIAAKLSVLQAPRVVDI